jgi:glycosyltransferase involved in cell wall biosynthesis
MKIGFPNLKNQSNKKILIATGLFPPQDGGPATYSKLLLDKLPSHGFEVKVKNFGDVLFLPKIVRHLVYFFQVFFAALFADTVYSQDPVSVGFPALIASHLAGKRFFLKIVGDYAWEQGSQRSGVTDLLDDFSTKHDEYSFFVRMLKRIQTFVANHAEKVIVPSQYLKKIVSNWGVDINKIHVIYNAFNPPVINETKEELRNKFGYEGSVIISPGRLVPWKGFKTLIGLMPYIIKDKPDTVLYILGEGPDRETLLEESKKNKVENNVHFLGRVSHKEALERIKASDIFVLNTSYEGFSHLILESMAIGTPVITTKAGGNPEIIQSGVNGIMVDYDDVEAINRAIKSILEDRHLSSTLGINSKKTVTSFTEEKMITSLIQEMTSDKPKIK